MQFELADHVLGIEDYIRLMVATGFMDRSLHQVEQALKMDCSLKRGLYDLG